VGCREGTSGGRDQPVANSVPDTAAVGIRHRAIATGLTSSRFDQLSVLEISAVKNRQVGVGDPNFRELEPDRALAAPARQPTLGCVRVQCHCGQPAPQPGAGERKIDQAVLVLADFEAHAGTRGLMKDGLETRRNSPSDVQGGRSPLHNEGNHSSSRSPPEVPPARWALRPLGAAG
jgi:hypothetical protein